MQLEPVIGLEIHVQLKTKSKMFCSCANVFGDAPPNSAICPICLGYPGTLPVPNQTAITWTQKAGAALGCTLAQKSKFDRKHYFYPDLPKGYQISQYDQPFCITGELSMIVAGQPCRIGITRIHLEEDAAKNIHPGQADYTLIDYNRAGTPLIEIVTEPDLKSPEQARIFLQDLQRIMRSLRISDADMEKGQLRCDANISLREKGRKTLNPKTEIKNLNSFRFVEKALQYEITRQTSEYEAGRIPPHATRGYNAEQNKTFEQRTKEEAADYRYFPEPDIPPFLFTPSELQRILSDVPELPHQKKVRLIRQTGISDQQADLLTQDDDLAQFFEETVSELQQLDNEQVDILPAEVPALVKLAANLIVREIRELVGKEDLAYPDIKITPQNFAEVVVLLHQKRINHAALSQILPEMRRTGGEPEPIIQKLGLEQVSDESQIETYVQQVVEGNPDVVAKIKAGKDTALQFLMGQVMAKSKGKAAPDQVIALLRKKILG